MDDCDPTDPPPSMEIREMYAKGGNSIVVEYTDIDGMRSWCFQVKRMQEAQ